MAENTAAPNQLSTKELLTKMMELGTTKFDSKMERYVHKRRRDGGDIVSLSATWEKLMVAARSIVEMNNPQDIFKHRAVPLSVYGFEPIAPPPVDAPKAKGGAPSIPKARVHFCREKGSSRRQNLQGRRR